MQVWDHHHSTLSGAIVVAGRMGFHYGWAEWKSEEFGWERVEWKTQRIIAAGQR